MGKIQCTSNKNKNSVNNDPIIIFNSKPQNWYEKKLKDEYLRLKDLSEGRKKPPAVDISYGLNKYKKQYSRFIKWSKIAYDPTSIQDFEKKRNSSAKGSNVSQII